VNTFIKSSPSLTRKRRCQLGRSESQPQAGVTSGITGGLTSRLIQSLRLIQSNSALSPVYTQEILEGGPRALIAAQHKAAKLSAQFGEEFEAQWCLTTPWLQELASGRPVTRKANDGYHGKDKDPDSKYQMSVRNRARARYALAWRPRFLAILALSKAPMMAARAAKVHYNTVRNHRKWDPDFEAQCVAAEEHAIQLLHDVTMKSAIEGECEPVFWQGIPVGHIRKYDNRLRIEMLRAHMPKTFKTPGSKIDISTGHTQNNNMFHLRSRGTRPTHRSAPASSQKDRRSTRRRVARCSTMREMKLDSGIRRHVKILREAGITTLASCEGRKNPGYYPKRDGAHHGDWPNVSDAYSASLCRARNVPVYQSGDPFPPRSTSNNP